MFSSMKKHETSSDQVVTYPRRVSVLFAPQVVTKISPSKTKVSGGTMRDSFLVNEVAFKMTFSYAGFEQQPNKFLKPNILLFNIELDNRGAGYVIDVVLT